MGLMQKLSGKIVSPLVAAEDPETGEPDPSVLKEASERASEGDPALQDHIGGGRASTTHSSSSHNQIETGAINEGQGSGNAARQPDVMDYLGDQEAVDVHRNERIQQAAYALAEKRGFAPGKELDDWLEAELAYGATAIGAGDSRGI